VKEILYSKKARIRSRRNIVQAYYQWLLNKQPVSEIIHEFKNDRNELLKADLKYFESVLAGMISESENIKSVLIPILDRAESELDPVENAILHLGTYELLFLNDIPEKVIINESIELAKLFGAEESHKYINGVMDKLTKIIRKSAVRKEK
jgi:transcription antitermination protein NusB